jgi:hypothetical protein
MLMLWEVGLHVGRRWLKIYELKFLLHLSFLFFIFFFLGGGAKCRLPSKILPRSRALRDCLRKGSLRLVFLLHLVIEDTSDRIE